MEAFDQTLEAFSLGGVAKAMSGLADDVLKGVKNAVKAVKTAKKGSGLLDDAAKGVKNAAATGLDDAAKGAKNAAANTLDDAAKGAKKAAAVSKTTVKGAKLAAGAAAVGTAGLAMGSLKNGLGSVFDGLLDGTGLKDLAGNIGSYLLMLFLVFVLLAVLVAVGRAVFVRMLRGKSDR